MGAAGIAILVLAVCWVLGRLFATQWLVNHYRHGAMADRTLALALAAVSVVPWLLITAILLAVDPASWWLMLLLFIASWPLIILPAVAVYHQSKGTRSPE